MTEDDRVHAVTIFEACGLTDAVKSEAHIECFIAITGPVPGFVAFDAKTMVDDAVGKRPPPKAANRAIRQLFLGTGTLMSEGVTTPAGHVKQMIGYAGPTPQGCKR